MLEADGFSNALTIRLELEDKTMPLKEGFLAALWQTGPLFPGLLDAV